ncbi:MAG: TIGR02450 family Trp-rich protein [Methylotenera sp.]
MKSSKRFVNAKKLLNSKWTAVNPINKEKHFLVTKLITPETNDQNIELIELEAVFTKRCQILPWQQLNESALWLQGWL